MIGIYYIIMDAVLLVKHIPIFITITNTNKHVITILAVASLVLISLV